MVSEFLRSVETMFIAEKPLSSSAVDIGIIFSTFIKGTKPAGIYYNNINVVFTLGVVDSSKDMASFEPILTKCLRKLTFI